jgi:hypothetical protein
LFILFDAFNEMPVDGFATRAGLLRDFIERWQTKGNRFLVTCRLLDYEQQLQGLQRVEVQPFSPEQIQAFLRKVLHTHWEKMWHTLNHGSDTDHRLLEMAANPFVLRMMVSEFLRCKGELSTNRAELMTGFTTTLLAKDKKKAHLRAIFALRRWNQVGIPGWVPPTLRLIR